MILLTFAYILNVIDYIFTAFWVQKFGIEIETNPIGRWMFENDLAGAFKILFVGALFALLGICILLKPKYAWVSIIPCVAYGAIVIYHLVIFFYI